MSPVFLGIGSNIERERYIVAGLDALANLFGELALSSVYDSQAIGFSGQPFLNLVVGIATELSPGELSRRLRHIEMEHGRPANATRYSPRHLDIDILTHGQLTGKVEGVELPRAEILENAF
ncbi:MAG: 2-amino-4-hydroxy-6-hydroxymethyldihydropteridine diphosphokinase, partial [Halioglobus sp.]|nr:2-amino-4-hydroxy-6-hydroxymethyldihydropteridine diphosphokinase [Halioglobus sp.]